MWIDLFENMLMNNFRLCISISCLFCSCNTVQYVNKTRTHSEMDLFLKHVSFHGIIQRLYVKFRFHKHVLFLHECNWFL
jgi:hypothetical protein